MWLKRVESAGLAETRYRVAAGVVSCVVRDEIVLLDATEGVYYALNPVAARVWELLGHVHSHAEVCRVITEEYEVDADRCTTDISGMLDTLLEYGLIETVEAGSDTPHPVPPN